MEVHQQHGTIHVEKDGINTKSNSISILFMLLDFFIIICYNMPEEESL